MKLICEEKGCGYEWFISGAHHRYINRLNKCPQDGCDGRGRPDQAAREQIASRGRELYLGLSEHVREEAKRANLEKTLG